jgi:alcohol dehydrogenase (cytochrome c)
MKLASIAAMAMLTAAAIGSHATAADMSFERALKVEREPQNWLLHHQDYQGHRFSALKQIDTNTVGNLRLAFTVGLGGLQEGGRHAQGNLEATPLVDGGMMYLPDGWGSVYAIDVSRANAARSSGSSIPASTAPGLATWRAAASITAALRCGRTR